MKIEDFKLVCIKDKGSDTWSVYLNILPGLISDVKALEDAPKIMAELFEATLKYGFNKGIHEIHDLSNSEAKQ
jgi:hypothetical protein